MGEHAAQVAEQIRQLRAARDGRYRRNEHSRYLIDGETRPDRKERERLMGRGWLDWQFGSGTRGVVGMRLTSEGASALRVWEAENA